MAEKLIFSAILLFYDIILLSRPNRNDMKKINNIAQDSRVAIYGAGEIGVFIKNYIQEKRPDLKVICFFDKTVQGDIDGIKIHNIKDIQDFVDSFDIIIIGSASSSHLMEIILNYFKIDNYLKINNLGAFFHKNYAETGKLNAIKNILSPQSRLIFEMIVNCHSCKNCLDILFEHIQQENSKTEHIQYLDFINKDTIKTVFSGGAYDGGTSLLFLNKFKNVEKIYAFEPMYEKFKCEINDEIIKKSPKIEIVEKGLYDRSAEISFEECESCAAGSRVNNNLSPETCTTIQTVSIDEFVEEKNIEKVDFIKMDIEGSELPALKGGEKTIKSHRPQLAICIYHSYSDLFEIPLYLDSILEDYKFEVYHYSLINQCESVFYAIPNELFKD